MRPIWSANRSPLPLLTAASTVALYIYLVGVRTDTKYVGLLFCFHRFVSFFHEHRCFSVFSFLPTQVVEFVWRSGEFFVLTFNYLDRFVLQSKSVETFDRLLSVVRLLIVDEAVAKALSCNADITQLCMFKVHADDILVFCATLKLNFRGMYYSNLMF